MTQKFLSSITLIDGLVQALGFDTIAAADLPAVSPDPSGVYTNANITVDQFGRVIVASSGVGGTVTKASVDAAGTTAGVGGAGWLGQANVFTQAQVSAPNDGQSVTKLVAMSLRHNTTTTPAVGFGVSLLFQLDSTTTANRPAAEALVSWQIAADASRRGQLDLGAHDAGTSQGSPRIAVTITTDGSQPLLGFFGGGPTAQPTVVGSKGGNAALASLLTALNDLGLIFDATT